MKNKSDAYRTSGKAGPRELYEFSRIKNYDAALHMWDYHTLHIVRKSRSRSQHVRQCTALKRASVKTEVHTITFEAESKVDGYVRVRVCMQRQ